MMRFIVAAGSILVLVGCWIGKALRTRKSRREKRP